MKESHVVVGPKLGIFSTGESLELANAGKRQSCVVLPAATGSDFLRQILGQIGGISAENYRPAFRQLNQQRHMTRGMARTGDGLHARRDAVFTALSVPLIRTSQLVGKHAAVQSGARGSEFISVDMHFATQQVADAADMVKMQMADKDQVDIGWRQSQSRQVARDTLLFLHVGRFDLGAHRVEVLGAQGGVNQFAVIAACIVEDAAVRRLDQVGEDGRVDELAVATIAG